ncbi:MAG: hypothetical protein AB7F74_05075 [Parvibaculaceae bacterium]
MTRGVPTIPIYSKIMGMTVPVRRQAVQDIKDRLNQSRPYREFLRSDAVENFYFLKGVRNPARDPFVDNFEAVIDELLARFDQEEGQGK